MKLQKSIDADRQSAVLRDGTPAQSLGGGIWTAKRNRTGRNMAGKRNLTCGKAPGKRNLTMAWVLLFVLLAGCGKTEGTTQAPDTTQETSVRQEASVEGKTAKRVLTEEEALACIREEFDVLLGITRRAYGAETETDMAPEDDEEKSEGEEGSGNEAWSSDEERRESEENGDTAGNPLPYAIRDAFTVEITALEEPEDGTWQAHCTFSNHDMEQFLRSAEQLTGEASYEETMEEMLRLYGESPMRSGEAVIEIVQDAGGDFRASFTEADFNLATGGFLGAYQEE